MPWLLLLWGKKAESKLKSYSFGWWHISPNRPDPLSMIKPETFLASECQAPASGPWSPGPENELVSKASWALDADERLTSYGVFSF